MKLHHPTGHDPLWSRGAVTPEVSETLFACAWAVPFVFVIPWRALVRDLLRTREPWRAGGGGSAG